MAMGWLALTGLVLRPVEHRLDSGPALVEPARQAAVRALLGGFRAAAADVAWLHASAAAERRNGPVAEAWLHLVTVLDPRPVYFWVNGARIMAYDIPRWRIEAECDGQDVPAAVQRRIRAEQAKRAVRFLDEARGFHPASAALWIERANIQLNQLGDVAGAAESYRRASEQPDAPYFAARLHAEMLRRLGRKHEALAWLVQLLPRLPATDEAAGAELVRERIRELEREMAGPGKL